MILNHHITTVQHDFVKKMVINAMECVSFCKHKHDCWLREKHLYCCALAFRLSLYWGWNAVCKLRQIWLKHKIHFVNWFLVKDQLTSNKNFYTKPKNIHTYVQIYVHTYIHNTVHCCFCFICIVWEKKKRYFCLLYK